MDGKTILFVEDEAKQLKYMQLILEAEGYRVLGAKDGLEAVALHQRRTAVRSIWWSWTWSLRS